MYSIVISSEVSFNETLKKTVLDIWVSSYEGFSDPDVMVLQEDYDMSGNKVAPIFHTIAVPAQLAEYRRETPEYTGGLYRDRKCRMYFKDAGEAEDMLASINGRLVYLNANMNWFNTATMIEVPNSITKYNLLVEKTTGAQHFNQKIHIEEVDGKNILLFKRTSNMGDLFIGVCTKEELVKYTETPDADGMFLGDSVDLVTYGSLVDDIVNKVIELVGEL